MATINDIVITVRWIYTGTENYPEIDDVMTGGNYQWQDITGQAVDPVTGICKTEPNVYLIRVQCVNARFTEIQTFQFMHVLARRTWDHLTPETILTDNFNNTVDQTQADAFIAFMETDYGLDIPTHLTDLLGEIIEDGATRKEIISRLAAKWRGFLKASS